MVSNKLLRLLPKSILYRSSNRAAFTLLELFIVLAIIGILATLLIPVYAGLRSRAQRVQCMANLQSLYVAADLSVQRTGSWPQISRRGDPVAFANAWITALAPFGPTRRTWICPTIQQLLGNPDYTEPAKARLDYIPMTFDDKPTTPHRWPRQPWFVEAGDVHGNGNLIIFTDGSVSELSDLIPK